MSKKTRKKSSKSAAGRSAAKAGGAKAEATKGTATNKSRTSAVGKKAKMTKSKTAAAKAASDMPPARKKPGKPVSTAASKAAALTEGETAPAFSLPRDGGHLVSLANYSGRKLVIFFYPRADTPGCTLEAVAFSRLAGAFADAQAAILGVSADSVSAQESFRDKHELTVPLVSDEKLGMLKAYGVWGEKSMYGKTFMGIVRTTVLVDAKGKLLRIWRNVRVNGHADEVLAAARAA